MNNISLPVYTDEPCSVTVDGQIYTLAEFGEDSSQIGVNRFFFLTYANNSVKCSFQDTIKRNSLGLLRLQSAATNLFKRPIYTVRHCRIQQAYDRPTT